VHLAFDAGQDPLGTLENSDEEQLHTAALERARLLLSTGVTTVRDL
jgi:hypothetical protein